MAIKKNEIMKKLNKLAERHGTAGVATVSE